MPNQIARGPRPAPSAAPLEFVGRSADQPVLESAGPSRVESQYASLSADSIMDTVREPLLVLGADLRVRKANRSFYRTFQVTPEETTGQLIYDLGNKQWDVPWLRSLLGDIWPDKTSFQDLEVDHHFPTIGRKQMVLNARRILQPGSANELILLAIEDVTERKRAEENRHEVEIRFTSLVKNIKDHAIFTMDEVGRITSWNVEAERILGYSESEIHGESFSAIFTREDVQDGVPEMELQAARVAGRAEDERLHLRKGGQPFWALGIVTPMYDVHGNVTGFSKILRDMTERKCAEMELERAYRETETKVTERTAELTAACEATRSEIAGRHRSEECKAAIVDVSLDAIIKIDHEGKVVEFNPAAERIFGYSRDQMVGKEMAEMILPTRLREIHRRGLAHYLVTGEGPALGKRLELSALRANGEEFPIELVIARIPGSGQPMFTGFIRDVTDRKEAESRLGAQHHTTKALAESPSLEAAAPKILEAVCSSLRWTCSSMWLVDPKSKKLELMHCWKSPAVNVDEFLEATRKTAISQGIGLPGRAWAAGEPAWVVDVTQDETFQRKEAAARCGLHGAVAFPIKCGRDVWGIMEFFSQRVEQPDGKMLEMMSAIGSQIGQFIERKKTESALRAREEQVRLLLDSTAEAIYGIDLMGNCTFSNKACARLLGRASPEDLLGTHMHEMIHHTDPKGAVYPVEACPICLDFRRGEKVHMADQAIFRIDGTSFPAEYWSHPIRSGECLVGFVVTFLDISERKKLEEQCRQSQKMEAFGLLAGGVAHDFNNLLTIISGYTEILLADVKPGDRSFDPLREIRKAGERAVSLTRQLLAFSRKQILQPRVLDLNELVAEVEKMIARLIGEDINLGASLKATMAKVKVDPGQIEQILVNLAVNARDAMPTGGHLSLETRNVELDQSYARNHEDVRPGRYVLLAVSDSGCGMDEATKARIFEPFFTTKGVGKGTGLGLATVHGIVKQSGGHIAVYSEPGVGTSFKIYLPCAEGAVAASQSATGLHPLRRGTETILLAEDEGPARAMVRLALQSQGYTVLDAWDGEEAARLCRSHPGQIDLLLTDVVMPKMSGRRLAELVETLRPGIKVLFASGYTDDAVVRHGIVHDGVAFLRKPFTLSVLARKVREVLDEVAA